MSAQGSGIKLFGLLCSLACGLIGMSGAAAAAGEFRLPDDLKGQNIL